MPYLVGMDEAGYGPNLGPLVVAASVWWVPDAAADGDLYDLLSAAVSRGEPDAARLAIADSKKLYRPGGGLTLLERTVFALLATRGQRPRDWHGVWQLLAGQSGAHAQLDPWFADYQRRLPVACQLGDVRGMTARFRAAARAARVRFCGLSCRAVFPEEFNRLTAETGNKSNALTSVTLALLKQAIEPLRDRPIRVVCDKHGGRNFYAPQLQQFVTDEFVEVRAESPRESIYRWGPAKSRVEVRFRVEGEAFLPTALASMTAKYLRELALLAFNEFWCSRVESLRPTAGYHVDARRFMREIAAVKARLAIADGQLWRER